MTRTMVDLPDYLAPHQRPDINLALPVGKLHKSRRGNLITGNVSVGDRVRLGLGPGGGHRLDEIRAI